MLYNGFSKRTLWFPTVSRFLFLYILSCSIIVCVLRYLPKRIVMIIERFFDVGLCFRGRFFCHWIESVNNWR
jgi:hypothetical protein